MKNKKKEKLKARIKWTRGRKNIRTRKMTKTTKKNIRGLKEVRGTTTRLKEVRGTRTYKMLQEDCKRLPKRTRQYESK